MIQFDNSISVGVSGGTTSFTKAFTLSSADNRFLVVTIFTDSSNDKVSGVTYNGVSMTRLYSRTDNTNSNRFYMYYLINPASGTHNIVVLFNTSTLASALASSYTGVKQTSPVEAYGSNASGSSNPFVVSATVTTEESWLVGGIRANGGATEGTDTTFRISGGYGQYNADSNGGKSAGSQSLQYSNDGSNGLVGITAVILDDGVVPAVGRSFAQII
jgi:hypothetical protein